MEKSKEQIALEVAEDNERNLVNELHFIRMYIDKLRRDLNLNQRSYDEIKPMSNSSNGDENPIFNPINVDRPANYDSELGLAKKFSYILKHYNRFLHFREVADIINTLDGTKIDSGKLAGKISASVQSLKGKQIFKHQAKGGHRNTFWGLKNWLNEDGSIKEGHEYNEEYIHKADSAGDLFQN